MGMYDTSKMNTEQRFSILESLVESLLHDKAMSSTDNGGCIGPDTHIFPILNDGGEVTLTGTDGVSVNGNDIKFEPNEHSNITVEFAKNSQTGMVTATVGVYWL